MMNAPIPQVAVFASGGGTNLQALLDVFGPDGSPDSSVRIALVVSDRPGIGALARAEKSGVRTRTVSTILNDDEGVAFAKALSQVMREHEIAFIALAGYVRLLPEAFVREFRGRIVNIHPNTSNTSAIFTAESNCRTSSSMSYACQTVSYSLKLDVIKHFKSAIAKTPTVSTNHRTGFLEPLRLNKIF